MNGRGRTRRSAAVVLALSMVAAACGSESSFSDIELSERSSTTASAEPDPSVGSTEMTLGLDTDQDDGEVDFGPGDLELPPPTPIHVDQFGYLPGDPKVAVLVDPEVGFDAELEFEPGETLEVRRVAEQEDQDQDEDQEEVQDQVVFSGSPEPWAGGQVHAQSGDRGWWFDFSSVRTPGTYYVIDVDSRIRSVEFEIGTDVYDEVLDAALKMFWYNRGNVEHAAEFAGPWADGAAYVGDYQDTQARSVDDRDNDATALDLSGGWFDAGDTNKYVTFASEAVHGLLAAYRRYPAAFDDDLGIPESGNGIPDIVDEVKWELDWLEKMQMEDGGVLTKVGVIDREGRLVPSESTQFRYYEEVCSSATIAAAGMYAHAAVVFGGFTSLQGDSARLRQRAVDAWDWYQANPKRDDCDEQVVRAGDADLSIEEQARMEVTAAVYLFALTGGSAYNAAIRDGYEETMPFIGRGFGDYAPDQSEALLFYRNLPGASPAAISNINSRLAALRQDSPLLGFTPEDDLYRSYLADENYHWGSNMVKANVGAANLSIDAVRSGRTRALGHLHYFHGVNPFGLVYLSNMGEAGAERSVRTMFHYWFGEKTEFDIARGSAVGVAPGYLVGGPNSFYGGGATPPSGQPPLKSYRDWSAYGSEPSWEITEPAIYYQAAYVRLLAAIVATGG